jgi:YbbR domain-containing protein
MRAKLWQLIVRNWPIKIASGLLALMLYVAVQAQQPVTQYFGMKLDIDVPPGRSLLQKPPTVWITISGKGADLLRLRTFPSTISKSVPDTLSASSWQIRLENADVPVPKGVDLAVLDITPREVTVSLDTVTRKEVRVVPLVSVVPESGYVMRGGLSISPSIARLVGPERNLAAIESVMTVPTEITNVTGGFQRALPIDTSALGIIRIAPKQIMLTGEVEAVARRTFAGIVVESGAGQLVGVTLEPSKVSVSVVGPGERVDRLTRDSVRVVAVLAGDGQHARLRVLAPPGIDARATPDTVSLRRRTTTPRPRG